MTRDEILSMPAGRELDALVAERVMGWDIHPVSPDPYEKELAWYSEDGKLQCGDEYWKPSENIADAFQVVEKMKELGYKVQRFGTGDLMGDKWQASFADVYRIVSYKGDKGDFADADTLPLAISQAALLAVLT